jgi:hypothetical protein
LIADAGATRPMSSTRRNTSSSSQGIESKVHLGVGNEAWDTRLAEAASGCWIKPAGRWYVAPSRSEHRAPRPCGLSSVGSSRGVMAAPRASGRRGRAACSALARWLAADFGSYWLPFWLAIPRWDRRRSRCGSGSARSAA